MTSIENKFVMDTHAAGELTGRPGNNDNNSNNPSNGPCPRMKEGQTIWQKATSLRQSLRQSSRVKLGQKSGFEFTSLPSSDKCATLGPSSSKSQQQAHKEWGSQRNLARERRSLAAVKPMSSDELAASKRSLHSRSLCMSGDWDMEGANDVNSTKQPRSPRKLTKDSGYETSAQCDPDYANSLSDWLSEEKVIGETAVPARAILPDKKDPRDLRGMKGKDERLEWNIRHRPLSFSHQEVTSECAKSHRQLRHSYSQREVSRHTRQVSVDTLATSTIDLKNPHVASVESVGAWSGNNPAVTKSTPHLLQGRTPRQSTSSSNLLHSESEEPGVNNMVTRRFKKGSVYDALASTSGLDFAPVVQLKAFNSRRDESSPIMQAPKPPEKLWEKTHTSILQLDNNLAKDNDPPVFTDVPENEPVNSALNILNLNSSPKASEVKRTPSGSKFDGSEAAKCLTAHLKYPSWPVVDAESPSVSQRSHSWTGKTDYPKEKIVYTRPKKAHQYKISTNQLQPVLERASDYNVLNKSPEALIADAERNHTQETYRVEFTGSIAPGERNGKPQYPGCSSSGECNGKQFDFEAFHTPSIPECFEDKDYRIHSPPERDGSSTSPSSKAASEAPTADSNGFLSRYEEVLRNQAQYSAPLSTWSKQRSPESIVGGGSITPDTPFLDRLRLDNGLQLPPPPPVPIQPLAAVPQLQQQQQLQQQGNDIELSSENGTWMGSMESSSHGRGGGIPKWQGSYSDLSTLSTQLSNRSSLFDSGHSTMPESGRLSPQSSCDSTAPSLLLEGPTRAQVVARHGCHREIVAHSARVKQPERHGSESILYYATGTTRSVQEGRSPSKSVDGAACSSHMTAEESLYRSHASLTLSPSQESKINKCPSRQDSRKSSNSYSSDDSYSRPRGAQGDDTSGSSSDVSNITCISNYKGSAKSTPKRSEKASPRDIMKPKPLDQTFPKYKPNLDPPKSKSMDETARKFVFPDPDKRQRVSDPELKAIQKQAVMSFYQRMSLASESIKSEPKLLIHAPGADNEPPPPYEASSSKLKMPLPKLSLPKVTGKQLPPRPVNQISPKPKLPLKASEAGLLNAHSKSVPNLVMFKGQNLDLPASHPIFKKPFGSKMGEGIQGNRIEKKRGSPLEKDEIISWSQLPNVLEKKREAMERAAPSSESKDPPEDNGGCSSGMHYLKPHKSPRKVQLKEVHHSNETASVKVMTPDGVTLVQTAAKGPQKRRPAPPPPPKQPPRRPPPPPPPVTPPPSEVMVLVDEVEGCNKVDMKDNKFEVSPSHIVSSASSPQLLHGSYVNTSPTAEPNGPASPDLPLPPPPSAQGNEMSPSDEPLPPPPDPKDVDVQSRTLDSSSLIYPKNSYMSYRSEKKFGRQGFDGKYHRSFRSSASSMDLTTCDSSFQDGKKVFSPNSWEQIHNIRQHGTTVIFHSDCLQGNRLQRSSSQDCVPVEETAHVSEHISNVGFQSPQSNQSSDSISAQCSEAQNHQQQSVPYQPPSHEKVSIEVQTSSPNSQNQNLLSTKGLSLKSKCSDDVIINCETADALLDNEILNDGGMSNIENDSNVDLNQNSLKNNKSERENSKIMNGTDLINRINSATQTTDTTRLYRKCLKSKEELECEQLSREFIHHYGDITLKNLLLPAPNHKTMTDYLEGLLNLEFDKNGHQDMHNTISATRNQSAQKEENCSNSEKCNSSFESKKINDSIEKNDTERDNQIVDNDLELKKKKEELMISIGKKVESFKGEQTNIRAEINQNELLGQKISKRLQELAKPNEIEKYSLHVEEMEKIVNLLLSLSGRLARAENLLKNLPKDCNTEEKKILEAKRDKLKDQHEDACRLKESIDRRSNQVSTFLLKYFSDIEYSDYDHFIKMKTKLIVDIRETDEKINLGVEQLAALSVVAHLWKSANS